MITLTIASNPWTATPNAIALLLNLSCLSSLVAILIVPDCSILEFLIPASTVESTSFNRTLAATVAPCAATPPAATQLLEFIVEPALIFISLLVSILALSI